MCLNPKDIPPDDLDDVILGRMVKEAGEWYQMELDRIEKKKFYEGVQIYRGQCGDLRP